MHAQSALGHEAHAILKGQGTCGDQGGKFAQRVTRSHVGLEGRAQAEGLGDGMQKDGRLGDLRLRQVLHGAFEHDGRQVKA